MVCPIHDSFLQAFMALVQPYAIPATLGGTVVLSALMVGWRVFLWVYFFSYN